MGVFGDAYFAHSRGYERRIMLASVGYEKFTRSGTFGNSIRGVQCKDVNYFGRPASLPANWWLDRGLIYSYDPLGWFEWYCWYMVGRRIPIYDSWQINRWVKFRNRHLRMYKLRPGPGAAQALLHWGISVRDAQ